MEPSIFENCIIINHYPITLRNGELVRDEWTRALEDAGYEIVRKADKD